MSAELVRKSLELFEDKFVKKDGKGKAKKHNSTNRQGVQKQLPSNKKEKKTFRSAIEKHQAESSKDHTAENIHLLKQLTDVAKTDETFTKKVFGYTDTKASHEPKEEESTVFTEADFEKFEKEYNFQ
ncbi:active regulator of SIRT1-like [Haliotis rubra]|uniref:active regulator of SIRT1-like n=1 Tax=Haliotis rubra TaxID=36100 RepID=UPI001EE590A5|nr:active regulator of SIRT1-like [Haliotis rubra]